MNIEVIKQRRLRKTSDIIPNIFREEGFQKVGFGVRGVIMAERKSGDKAPKVGLSIFQESRSSAEAHALGYECMNACVKSGQSGLCFLGQLSLMSGTYWPCGQIHSSWELTQEPSGAKLPQEVHELSDRNKLFQLECNN